MPTYDYVCDACGHSFEEFQSMTAETLEKCPECKKKKLRRLIGGGAAIIFKGSGFYETDYRSESYKEGAKASAGDDKPSDAKAGPDEKSKTSEPQTSGDGTKVESGGTKAPSKAQSPKGGKSSGNNGGE